MLCCEVAVICLFQSWVENEFPLSPFITVSGWPCPTSTAMCVSERPVLYEIECADLIKGREDVKENEGSEEWEEKSSPHFVFSPLPSFTPSPAQSHSLCRSLHFQFFSLGLSPPSFPILIYSSCFLFSPSLSVLLLLLESFSTRLPPHFSLSFHFMVQRCLATLLQMFCTIRGSLSDPVLFTARNNDIFIPVRKAATHEAISASIIQCFKKNGKIMTENYLNNFRCS